MTSKFKGILDVAKGAKDREPQPEPAPADPPPPLPCPGRSPETRSSARQAERP
jgi:hypothetical protein